MGNNDLAMKIGYEQALADVAVRMNALENPVPHALTGAEWNLACALIAVEVLKLKASDRYGE